MDVFNELPMPERVADFEFVHGLGVLDGCLSMSRVVSLERTHHNVSVMSMRQYGEKESWTMLFTIQCWLLPEANANKQRLVVRKVCQWQMTDEKEMKLQINEYPKLLIDLKSEKIFLPEKFAIGELIKKLLGSWSDYKNSLKHK
ncbi:hypothetical protein ACH5RR_032949 [Cinchona calisaya]|uniref:F-box associated domain-containing protein n=1 Tax=Cinchona calisaya TaxID=153742 RepID=A0ABD2YJJ7_9GENT